MVCNVAGALSEFEGPLTIVDFGTATTFTVVNAQSDICGVIIAPGMRISAEALTGRHRPASAHPAGRRGQGVRAQHCGMHAVGHCGRHSGDGGRHAGPDRRGTGYTGEADRHRRNFGTAGTADPPTSWCTVPTCWYRDCTASTSATPVRNGKNESFLKLFGRHILQERRVPAGCAFSHPVQNQGRKFMRNGGNVFDLNTFVCEF